MAYCQVARLDKVGRSDELRRNNAVPTSFVVTQEMELLLQQSLSECTWHVASSLLGPPVLNIFSWLAVLQPVAPQQVRLGQVHSVAGQAVRCRAVG